MIALKVKLILSTGATTVCSQRPLKINTDACIEGGRLPQFFPLSESWETTFTAGLQSIFDNEEATHGYDADMSYLRTRIIEKVIPRLLRPLETGPNKIKPRLVHGDRK